MLGRCLCGAVRIDVDRNKPCVSLCHCTMFRRWSGTVLACFEAPADAVRVKGPVKLWSSAIAERAWCEACGSHLWIRDTDAGEAPYDLMPGIFDDARAFGLDREVYADRAPAWAAFAGDHRRTSATDYEQTNAFVSNGDLP